jgi:hypothetical protein
MRPKKIVKMPTSDLYHKVVQIRNIENLDSFLGKEQSHMVHELFNRANLHDKELSIVHDCLSDLYNSLSLSSDDLSRIKMCLKQIKEIK